MGNPQPDPIFERIDRWFTYHPPVGGQVANYNNIRAAGRAFAQVLAENCPDSADRDEAILHARTAVMLANASVACGGK